MAAEATTYVSSLKKTAADYGVKLPEPVTEILDADLQIPTAPEAAETAASALVAALDEPRTYAKDRDQILDEYGRVLAAYLPPPGGLPVLGSAHNLLTRRRVQVILDHRDEIIKRFAAVMQADLDELAAISERVPFGTKKEAGILPSLAVHVAAGEEIAERVRGALTQIAFLWRNSPPAGMSRHLLVEIPNDLDRERLFRLKHALDGRREVRNLVSTDVIWWPGVHEFGAKFKVVTREQYADNVRRLDAAVRPVVVPEPSRSADAFYTPPAHPAK